MDSSDANYLPSFHTKFLYEMKWKWDLPTQDLQTPWLSRINDSSGFYMSFIYFAKELVLNSALWQHLGVSIKFIKEKNYINYLPKNIWLHFWLVKRLYFKYKITNKASVNVKVAVKLL